MNTPAVENKQIVEAVLFSSSSPVRVTDLKNLLSERGDISVEEVQAIVDALASEYRDTRRGFILGEVAGGYLLSTPPDLVSWIRKFQNVNLTEKLSSSSFETLSIIAYKQPITRSEIELIRGVNCGGILQHLTDKGLIRITGRKEIPGRPFLYGTTKKFLEYFRLKSIKDLPELKSTDGRLF